MPASRTQIHLMGGFRVSRGEDTIPFSPGRSPKLAEALAYLATPVLPASPYQAPKRRAVTRQALMDILWPAHDRVISNRNDSLSTLLMALRRKLEAGDIPSGSVLECHSSIWLTEMVTTDIEAFFEAVRHANNLVIPKSRAAALGDAFQKVLGPLLPTLYSYWIEPERRAFAKSICFVLHDFVDNLLALDEGAVGVAIGTSNAAKVAFNYLSPAIIQLPDYEQVYCDLLRLHLLANEPVEVTNRYAELVRILQDAQQGIPEEAKHICEQAQIVLKARHPGRPRRRLFGRNSLVAHVVQILTDMPPLVTLTGPPGAGKTKLAEEVFELLRGTFDLRIGPVRLEDISSADRIPEAILRHIPDSMHTAKDFLDGDSEALAAIVGLLGQAPCLLILDNFEHLMVGATGGIPLLCELLERIPTLTCMVTSRDSLSTHLANLRWQMEEIEVRVPVLVVPDEKTDFEAIRNDPCVELFSERAHAASPDFYLTKQNYVSVCRLCKLLDGLPLAIALAAGWARTHSPARMCSKIGALKRRSAPNAGQYRYPHLQAAVQGSFMRLGAQSARLLARLSVFRGGWFLQAAEYVCQDDTLVSINVAVHLSDLIERSLVEAETVGTERRFFMLQTIREFAAEQLCNSDKETLSLRHARYLANFVKEAHSHLTGPEQEDWWNRLAYEQDNFRAALDWCEVNPDIGITCRIELIGYLWSYWIQRGSTKEDRAHLKRIVSESTKLPASQHLARVINGAATLLHRQGEYRSAVSLFRCALRMNRQLNDVSGISSVLHNLGQMFQRQYKLKRARLCFEVCLRNEREAESSIGIAIELYAIARLLREQQNFKGAYDYCIEARARFEEAEHTAGIANAVNELGRVQQSLNNLTEAKSHFNEAAARFEVIGDQASIASALENLGMIARLEGDFALALRFMRKSLLIEHELDHSFGIAESFASISVLAKDLQDLKRSITLAGAREALLTRMHIPDIDSQSIDNEYRDHLDAIRREAGDNLFHEFYSLGQRMRLHEAIALAIRDAEA